MSGTNGQHSSRGVFVARTTANAAVCREHFRLTLEVENFPAASPGQFVQLLCTEPREEGWAGGVFLRRPFSIGGLRRAGGRCEIDILHRVVGTGTRWLSRLGAGDPVSVLGPLGRTFEVASGCRMALLVAGGIGLPPLAWLAESLRAAGIPSIAFCGARSADLLPLTRRADVPVRAGEATLAFAEFAALDVPVLVSTDDGSLGEKGLLPDAFARFVDAHPEHVGSAQVFTCGPDRMMRAVARACESRGLPCQVCLERVMACGMATCQSCVVRIRDEAADEGWRYRLCCTDGPVFDSRAVIWNEP